jgi:hypothetical protein
MAANARINAANQAFGMPGGQDDGQPATTDPANVELPKGFEKFLGR